MDTQVDVSPYVSPATGKDQKPRNGRDFIGYREKAQDWVENDKATRVDLTVLSSSNQLFTDYQPHNGNVFSICDNFAYVSNGETKYLKSCVASYLVFGWYSDTGLPGAKDPLHHSKKETFPELLGRLQKSHIRLIGLDELEANNFVEGDTLTLMWGNIHKVKWSADERPEKIPAQEKAKMFKDPKTVPVAVGTGPLDALLAYIHSHKPGEAEELILKIQTLLLAQEDGVDADIAAEDLLLNADYDRSTGGIAWFLSENQNADEHPPDPKDPRLVALRLANATQAKLGTLYRTLPALRWELFTYWWTYLCDPKYGGEDPTTIEKKVRKLSDRLAQILAEKGPQSVYYELPKSIGEILTAKGEVIAEAGTAERFYQYQDPTLLIAGLESGWSEGHMEDTPALSSAHFKGNRFSALHIDGASADTQSARDEMEKLILKVMPSKLEPKTVAMGVVDAFLVFDDKGKNLVNDLEQNEWNGQPWCPLILEWEAEYYHIPFESWQMNRLRVNKPGTTEHVQWGFPDDKDVSKIEGVLENFRRFHGRVLLLPQPGFSLDAKVKQLFTNVNPEELNKAIDETQRKRLITLLETAFPYLSSPLAGLTDHLLTVQQGTHINPNERKPKSTEPEPTYQAIQLAGSIGVHEIELKRVADETGPTPYANQVLGLSQKYPAFKPATHGQFRFTKINIIDKFGQAISVIDQSPAPHPPPIYPCVSDLLTVQPFGTGSTKRPNTVDGIDHDGYCEFIQITPRINQPVRLNSHFLVKDAFDPTTWRASDDWDNPIFGWLLINFANYSLQVFLKDGRFYREIRLGGASGITASPPWLPFSKPGNIPEGNEELDEFLKPMMEDPIYLKAVYQLILNSFDHIKEVPDSYAEFLSALVGKPVVLTNIGFSFELDTAPKSDKTLYGKNAPTRTELPVEEYDVRLKIGDEKRVYDGLIGYLKPGDSSKIYTYHSKPVTDPGPLEPITDDSYLKLKPFFIDPGDGPATDYIKDKDSKLQRRIALLDPFVALHGYTGGIAPITEIKLPKWTIEKALNNMTAFFQLGPLLATKDVPKFNPSDKLKEGYSGDVKPYGGAAGAGISFPSGLKREEWIWLQPYATGVEKDTLEYMALNLDETEEVARLEPAPYSAVEGYIQLKRALGGMPPPDEK